MSTAFEQLLVLRLITGFFLGFTISAPFPIAAELMPAQHRRTYAAIYETMLAMAFTLLPFVGFILADHPRGFQLVGLPGGVTLFIAPVLIYFLIPESPRWLLRRGRAQDAVDGTDHPAMRRPGAAADNGRARDRPAGGREQLPPFWKLFARGQFRWTAAGILCGICAGTVYYLIAILLPKALVSQGAAVALSFGLSSMVFAASIPGKLFNGFIMEVIGRRWTITGAFLLSIPGLLLMMHGASRRIGSDDRLYRRRVDHRVYDPVDLPRGADVSVRAISDRAARPRAFFRRILRAHFRRGDRALCHGFAYRLAVHLFWHDDHHGRNRCLHPVRDRQRDRRQSRNRNRSTAKPGGAGKGSSGFGFVIGRVIERADECARQCGGSSVAIAKPARGCCGASTGPQPGSTRSVIIIAIGLAALDFVFLVGQVDTSNLAMHCGQLGPVMDRAPNR